MPKKKPLDISAEFVAQVLAVIANESEAGRKKIVALSKRAEEKYDNPVKSWITGWVYQYTRTRGGKIMQSIKVMEDFPDAYTRLQEFRLMMSEGEWNYGSYNYFLFLELINEIPDYEHLEDEYVHLFVLRLKDLVISQIDIFMLQYKSGLEERKTQEMEQYAACQSVERAMENVLVFNDLAVAKALQPKDQNSIIFSLYIKEEHWQLNWIDATGAVHPLTLSEALVQKLETMAYQGMEKLSLANLNQIKNECIKVRDQYVAKIEARARFTGKLDLGWFPVVKTHMEEAACETSPSTPEPVLTKEEDAKGAPEMLNPERHSALLQLPTFWQQRRLSEIVQKEVHETPALIKH